GLVDRLRSSTIIRMLHSPCRAYSRRVSAPPFYWGVANNPMHRIRVRGPMDVVHQNDAARPVCAACADWTSRRGDRIAVNVRFWPLADIQAVPVNVRFRG